MTEHTAHYTVLARRFRPQTFEEVVGQDRIGQALRNAIQSGRVAHAYLFTGARGVGKTSTARIFAKALNCPQVRDAVPCNECEVCQSIASGSDLDVLEIDGASNRGIDDIRTLRANVTVKSMRSPFKVYIIDEVHMLTKEAFNALLKTLEEPPPGVKFVFCTTEPNKVPDTILSRCQRFDFGTIAPADIMSRLGQIAEAEEVPVDEAALELLSRRAAGSMRDSQSLFDQLLAFGSDHITADDVHQLLGTASDDRLIRLMNAIIERRRDDALTSLDAALQEGVQIGALSDQLLHYLRDLLLIAAGADTVPLESVSEPQRAELATQASGWGLRTITAALEILSVAKSRMQRVNHDRTLMELAVVRLSLLEELDHIGALIATGLGGPESGVGASEESHSGQPASRPAPQQPASTDRVPPPDHTPAPRESPSASKHESGSDSTVAPEPETDSSTGKESRQAIGLSPESLDVFWPEVVAQLTDRLQGHLQKADSLAISGPNRLELSFPQSYVSSKQFCERPDNLARIAASAARVAGEVIEITLAPALDGGSPPPSQRTKSKDQPASRVKKLDVSSDPFVQQALDIFGGTLIDVREIPQAAGEGQ